MVLGVIFGTTQQQISRHSECHHNRYVYAQSSHSKTCLQNVRGTCQSQQRINVFWRHVNATAVKFTTSSPFIPPPHPILLLLLHLLLLLLILLLLLLLLFLLLLLRLFFHYPCTLSPSFDRLVGLVVKASASRAEGPGFESRLRRDFFGVE